MTSRWIAIAAGAALVAAGAGVAAAQTVPACSSIAPADHTVYMQIGDTQVPLIKELGRALRDNTPDPINIVYVTAGSCVNIQAMYNATAITTNMSYIPSSAEMPGWTTSMNPLPCTVPAGGVVPDVTNSNVFISACDPNPVPAGFGAFTGPIQAYVLAVPEASTQTAITAEEAYFLFGFGNGDMIAPWNDESQIFIRTSSKSTLVSWAYNVGVLPPSKWKGIKYDQSSQVVTSLQNAGPNAEKAIGILGAEVYDQFRSTLNVLAFQTYGQKAAYYPDSTRSATDKLNVRDGHYTVWSPTVYLTRTTGGVPQNPQVAYVIDLIRAHTVTPAPDFNPQLAVIHVGLVPDCAMKVTRSTEGGELSLYHPSESCTCFYDQQTSSSICASCDTTDDCAAHGGGVCRDHLCEAW